jgi:hypothetical protein
MYQKFLAGCLTFSELIMKDTMNSVDMFLGLYYKRFLIAKHKLIPKKGIRYVCHISP